MSNGAVRQENIRNESESKEFEKVVHRVIQKETVKCFDTCLKRAKN